MNEPRWKIKPYRQKKTQIEHPKRLFTKSEMKISKITMSAIHTLQEKVKNAANVVNYTTTHMAKSSISSTDTASRILK